MSIMILSCVFVLVLLLALIKVFHKLWWTPFRIQKTMALQGITGRSYRLLYGNVTEILNLRKQSMMNRGMRSLSHDIFSHVQPHIHSWSKNYGKIYLQWHGVTPVLVVTDTELCKEILNNKQGVYEKPKAHNNFVKKLFGDSVVITEGEKWAKLRKVYNNAFHGESLINMFPDMIASAEILVKRWKNHEGKEIEVFEEFRLLTSDVISRTAFGSNYIQGKENFEMMQNLMNIVYRNTLSISLPVISKIFKTRDDIESDKIEKGIRVAVMEIVKKREEEAKNGDEDRYGKDFLGFLLKANHATNKKQKVSVEELLEECKTVLLAGQETTSTLLGWTTLLLALHPEWQEKARKEVMQLFGKQLPTHEGISKLHTMNMIINESLRLYPPATLLLRKASREVRLGKFLVPANVQLLVPTLAIHHEPQLWGEDAVLFKPERFSEGIAKATNDNMATFMPFGLGPRICAGFNLAAVEAKITLSMILQHFSFTLSPGYRHSPFLSATVRPQHGVQVILQSL